MIENVGKIVDLKAEAEALVEALQKGDIYASHHLARLIEADTMGSLRPFAEAVGARLCDHLNRYAELGICDSHEALEDEVYRLIQAAAVDWNGLPCAGRPGEEAKK